MSPFAVAVVIANALGGVAAAIAAAGVVRRVLHTGLRYPVVECEACQLEAEYEDHEL